MVQESPFRPAAVQQRTSVGADQRPARGSFPQRGDCGLALPVAEEARAQFPQRSKKRRNSEARTVFRAPQGGQVASADLTRGRRRMRESDGQEPTFDRGLLPPPSLSLAHRRGRRSLFFDHPRRGYHNYSLFIIHFSLFILQQNGGPMRRRRPLRRGRSVGTKTAGPAGADPAVM